MVPHFCANSFLFYVANTIVFYGGIVDHSTGWVHKASD